MYICIYVYSHIQHTLTHTHTHIHIQTYLYGKNTYIKHMHIRKNNAEELLKQILKL